MSFGNRMPPMPADQSLGHDQTHAAGFDPAAAGLDVPGRPAEANRSSAWRRVGWRMKGRWRWAALAAAGAGVAAGLAGWQQATVRYEARGAAVLSASFEAEAQVTQELALLQQISRTQVGEMVVQRDALVLHWAARGDTPEQAASLAETVRAQYDQQTTLHAQAAERESVAGLHQAWREAVAQAEAAEAEAEALALTAEGLPVGDALSTASQQRMRAAEQRDSVQQRLDLATQSNATPRQRLDEMAKQDRMLARMLNEQDRLLGQSVQGIWPVRFDEAAMRAYQALHAELAATAEPVRLVPIAALGEPMDDDSATGWLVVRPAELQARQGEAQAALDEAEHTVSRLSQAVSSYRHALREATAARSGAEAARVQWAQREAALPAAAELVSLSVEPGAVKVVDQRAAQAALWGGAGLVLGGLLVVLGFGLDTKLRRPVAGWWRAEGAPLLTAVPEVQGVDQAGPPRSADEAARVQAQATGLSSSVQAVRAILESRVASGEVGAFAVTSAASGSGKTSLTVGLAAALGMAGHRVLLVDAAWTDRPKHVPGRRKPEPGRAQTLDEALAAMDYLDEEDQDRLAYPDGAPVGLPGLLRGGSIDSCVIQTRTPGLWLLAGADADAGDVAMLSTRRLSSVLRQAAGRFDVVLFDTAPANGAMETLVVAGVCDGVVFVVRPGEKQAEIDEALGRLRMVQANLVGTVFNRLRMKLGVEAGKGKGWPSDGGAWRTQGSGMFAAAVRTHAGRTGTSMPATVEVTQSLPPRPTPKRVPPKAQQVKQEMPDALTMDAAPVFEQEATAGQADPLLDVMVDRIIDAAMSTAERRGLVGDETQPAPTAQDERVSP